MVKVDKNQISEGLPHRLGATWDGGGVDFALFSAHATRVEIRLFDQNESNFPNIPMRFGTATCRMCTPARSIAIACTALRAVHRFNMPTGISASEAGPGGLGYQLLSFTHRPIWH